MNNEIREYVADLKHTYPKCVEFKKEHDEDALSYIEWLEQTLAMQRIKHNELVIELGRIYYQYEGR